MPALDSEAAAPDDIRLDGARPDVARQLGPHSGENIALVVEVVGWAAEAVSGVDEVGEEAALEAAAAATAPPTSCYSPTESPP